ncbi:MAG: pyrroloquinoline quinone biosynthesis protein PqqB [Rhodospirillales bacterium]
MRIVILGSAAGGGFPQWNCNCPGCRRARAGDPAAQPRTQASLAVAANDRHWLLVNASPDIRQQIAANPRLSPPAAGVRGSPIVAVVLTNADVDHIAGLLSLRERQPLSLHAASRVLSVLDRNPVFDVLDRALVARLPLALDEEVAIAPAGGPVGLAVTAFAVPGKVALWLEEESGGDLTGEPEDTVGLRISEPATGRHFFYIPGCAGLTPALARRLTGAPLVLFDGTTWRDDEMAAAGAGAKTAARMGHMSMDGAGGSLAAFAPLRVHRKIYTHINNTNPVLLADSIERRRAEAAGWEIAWDGMEIVF